MAKSDDFELIECVSAEGLARHPVWSHWDPDVDRPRVLGWGVAPDVVDRWVARFEGCGPVPLYPLLELGELDGCKDRVVAARFEGVGGVGLAGYLLDPFAFGVFLGGEEYSFNRSLPSYSEREALRLAAALGRTPEEVFPLFYRVDDRVPGESNEGAIGRFW